MAARGESSRSAIQAQEGNNNKRTGRANYLGAGSGVTGRNSRPGPFSLLAGQIERGAAQAMVVSSRLR